MFNKNLVDKAKKFIKQRKYKIEKMFLVDEKNADISDFILECNKTITWKYPYGHKSKAFHKNLKEIVSNEENQEKVLKKNFYM